MVSENVVIHDLERWLQEMEKGMVGWIFKKNFLFAELSHRIINIDFYNWYEYETCVVESPLIY